MAKATLNLAQLTETRLQVNRTEAAPNDQKKQEIEMMQHSKSKNTELESGMSKEDIDELVLDPITLEVMWRLNYSP